MPFKMTEAEPHIVDLVGSIFIFLFFTTIGYSHSTELSNAVEYPATPGFIPRLFYTLCRT